MSPDKKIFYLNIPKNASTYISNLLLHNSWEKWNIFEDPQPIETCIVFLRDPIDRWISGFSTYSALRLFGYGYGSDHFLSDFNTLSERIIFDQIIFDDHTELQVNYIKQVLQFNIVYFRCHEIVKHLNYYLNTSLDDQLDIESNHSESNFDTFQISKFLKDLIFRKPELSARIVDAYKEDYNLINSIEFYNVPR